MDEPALTEAWLREGFSRKTIACYLVAVRRAERELAARGVALAAPSALELSDWVADALPRTRSTRAQFRAALSAYWRATGGDAALARAIPVPRRPRMRCRALEDGPAAALAAEARRRALRGTRKGLAVLLGLYGGLRRTEIAELRFSDVGADGWVQVVSKGSERTFPLHPVLVEALGVAGGAPRPRRRSGDRVFVGRWGGPLNPTTVWTWVRELSEASGTRPVGVHVLRHTALATALDATRDLRAVQELAGHARPETTAGYTRVRRRRLEDAVAAIGYGT